MNKMINFFMSLSILFSFPSFADYEFTLEWPSAVGVVNPKNGLVITEPIIWQYWVKEISPIDGTVLSILHKKPKSETDANGGYSYSSVATVPSCYQIMVVFTGRGFVDQGQAVCIDPSKDLPPMSCTTDAVKCMSVQ